MHGHLCVVWWLFSSPVSFSSLFRCSSSRPSRRPSPRSTRSSCPKTCATSAWGPWPVMTTRHPSQEAKVLREKALEKEVMARRMEEQKNRAFRSAPRRPRPRARVPTRTDERSAEKRSSEQERVRTWTDITNSHGSREQQYQQPPRGSSQGTGTTSRVSATHVGAAITDAASSSTAGVCSDGSHSTARGNATSSNGVDIRGDAAKDLARVVRDGSTPEGRRLREQLWVWLHHLQDEEATEPVPKQLQSWLTGQKTQQ